MARLSWQGIEQKERTAIKGGQAVHQAFALKDWPVLFCMLADQ
ncbi:MAG: hypothetical protein AAFR90_01330 [Pseudomonadota bacterium]